MKTTSKSLELMVAAAEEQGVECENVWRDSVLEGVYIGGEYVENTSYHEELQLALEGEDLYAGDEREARAYYNN